MGVVMLAGGLIGSAAGVWLFALLQGAGPDRTRGLGAVRGAARRHRRDDAAREPGRHAGGARGTPPAAIAARAQLDPRAALQDAVPPLQALHQRHTAVGAGRTVGILAAVMGVGGGFLMVPAMIYLLRMPTSVVIGTSQFQNSIRGHRHHGAAGGDQPRGRHRAGVSSDRGRRHRRAGRRARRHRASARRSCARCWRCW